MSFLKKRTNDVSLKVIGTLIRECSKKGGPRCKTLQDFFEAKDYRAVIDYSFDYRDAQPQDIDDFIYARQIQAFLAKQDFLDLGVDKEKVAFEAFLRSEELCRDTNYRFENAIPSGIEGVEAVMFIAQRKISKILGDVPSLDTLDFSFGPGATTSTKGAEANSRVKLSARLECSSNFIPLVGRVLYELPHILQHHAHTESDDFAACNVDIVSGKLMFVPKNCLTDRTIVVEPPLNGLIQKSIGSFIRRKLRKCGIDLRDQTVNQKLAQRGSIHGDVATIDLSSASDTIARQLVWSLLPYPWVELLDQCRSESVVYKNDSFVLEKFSSMGNAFTFELESLIFYALTYATCSYLELDHEKDVSVYGDDIICPVESFPLLTEVLHHCGFILNEKKTFCEGSFRESCGTDYLFGIDIRPFYQRHLISDQNLFVMHNWFVRHCEFDLAGHVLPFLHPEVMLWGPDGYGDGHLIGSHDIRTSRKLTRSGWSGGFFDTYVLNPKRFKKPLPGDWIYPVYSIYVSQQAPSDIFEDKPVTDPDTVRGSRGYTKISIYTLAQRIFCC
jgi:hypothetical protein